MEIKKGNINLFDRVAKGFSNALVEGDVVLPDTKPDMAEILSADAKVNVWPEDCAGGVLTVKGEVIFNALYIPEGSEEVNSTEQVLPFFQTVELKCTENADYKVDAVVEHIGFTLVNSRKLSAKVMIAISAEAFQTKEYTPVTEAESDDVEIKCKKYSIYTPLSQTKAEISVSDILTVPGEKPDIGEIVKIDAYITPGDVKVMSGKAMIHADLHISTVYTASDNGELTNVHHTIPVTDVVEAPGADEQSAIDVSYKLLSIFATGKGDLKGDTKIISIDANICAQVSVSKIISEKIVDDCYFMDAKAELKRENMKISEYITSENARVPVQTKIEVPKNVTISEVVDCSVKSIIRECVCHNGIAEVKGNILVSTIYKDDAGKVHSAVAENDVKWQKPIGEECNPEAQMWTENVNCEWDENGIRVLCNEAIHIKVLKNHSIDIITDIHKKEEAPSQKPGMVVYFTKEGDTLWSVAKRYRTKTEKIKNANNLESDRIDKGRRLLIPR